MATVLNSVDVTLETRARARLAGHQFVIDAVKSFRNKYPDWKLCITELLNDLGSKHRAKNKPNEKKSIKSKTEKKSKKSDNNDKTTTEFKEFEKSDKTQSESEDTQSESETQSELEETQSEPESIIDESDSYISDAASEENQTKEALIINKSPIKNKTLNNELDSVVSSKTSIPKENMNISKCDKTITTTEVNVSVTQMPKLENKKLPDKSSNSLTNNFVDTNVKLSNKPSKRKAEPSVSSKVDNRKKRIMVDDIKPVCETIDSFFMTADDKDYMSVYKPPPLSVEKDKTERPKFSQDYSKPPKEIYIKGKKVAVIKPKNTQNFTGNRRERRQQVEEPVDTVLHPSWEAKRKQKTLVKFEGKKITFDEED